VPKNLIGQSLVREQAEKLYEEVFEQFNQMKQDQTENIDNFWDIYNCKLNDNQVYSGDSQVYVPVVHDCIEARVKRHVAMLFPSVGKYIDVVSEHGDIPNETIAILNRHVDYADLRKLVPSIARRGDVEGQWTVELGWSRAVTKQQRKVEKHESVEEFADIEESEIVDEGPTVSIIGAQDLAVIPATCSDISEAEIVAVRKHLSKRAVEGKVSDGWFDKDEVERMNKGSENYKDKKRAADAGVKLSGGTKYAQIYAVWTKLKVKGEKTPCLIYFGGPDVILGIFKNPYWCGRPPILSEPVDILPGSFFGKSKIAPVEQIQYQINDMANMGMDSAQYGVLPIVMTDPLKNPRVGSMILSAGAIWETSPNDTQFGSFPPLWKDAMTMVTGLKQQIMESMDVNDAMLGKAPQGRKNAQAIAQQQGEAMATISDVVKRFEGMLSNILEWFYELDLQFREDDLLVKTEGEVGIQAVMQRIPPQEIHSRYLFKWMGTEQIMGAQRVQQMIGFMNVARGIPPQQLNGRTFDFGPMLDYATNVIFGPNLAPKTLIDERHKTSIPPDMENEFLFNNITVIVSPNDNDQEHLQIHTEYMKHTGDLNGLGQIHIRHHMAQMQAKLQANQPKPQGQPGIPGPPNQPGVAGTPRPGAMPMQGRPIQQPPGAIHADVMADPNSMPRG
jgi:hypothetical protein